MNGPVPFRWRTEQVYRALAIQYQMPFVDLNYFTIRPEAILAVPQSFVRRYQVIPLVKTKHCLILAVSDPRKRRFYSLLYSVIQVANIERVMASPKAIWKMIENYYGVQQKAA